MPVPAGAVEGVNAIQTGLLLSLSEQELVDCDKDVDMGCVGRVGVCVGGVGGLQVMSATWCFACGCGWWFKVWGG